MKKTIKSLLAKANLQVRRLHPKTQYFEKLFLKYKDYTMIPKELYISNLLLVNNFKKIKGAIVECGVWRGGMSAGMAEILTEKEIYLFDSFEGLPDAKEIDGDRALQWQKNTTGKTYYNNCRAEMDFASKAMGMTNSKYHLIKGWFSETMPTTIVEGGIAVLRLDADWYESTMECFTHLYPQLNKGGVIIIDDYYAWDGCSKAVHDYLSQTKSISRIHRTNEGVAYIIKLD